VSLACPSTLPKRVLSERLLSNFVSEQTSARVLRLLAKRSETLFLDRQVTQTAWLLI
jgi:hypothetical protein